MALTLTYEMALGMKKSFDKLRAYPGEPMKCRTDLSDLPSSMLNSRCKEIDEKVARMALEFLL